MTRQLYVRSRNGLIPRTCLEQHGFSILGIKEWREKEYDAGRPNGLDDFYAFHGLCFDCQSNGVQMVGWSDPADGEEVAAAKALEVEQLPVFAVCTTCDGTGKADRSKWKKPAADKTHGSNE
jgi:hypothetical protein